MSTLKRGCAPGVARKKPRTTRITPRLLAIAGSGSSRLLLKARRR